MGVKHDSGKTRPSLVILSMSRALQAVSEVATFGAEKYTDDGWREVPDGVRRYTDAMLRHQLAEASGEANDPESGLAHAAHVAWNALARLDLMLRAPVTRQATFGPRCGASESVSDGTYDNRSTMRRERWVGGKVVESLSAAAVDQKGPYVVLIEPFGTYPDIPRP